MNLIASAAIVAEDAASRTFSTPVVLYGIWGMENVTMYFLYSCCPLWNLGHRKCDYIGHMAQENST